MSDPTPQDSVARSAPGSNIPELSVSDLAGAIKRALEDGFGVVRIRGEISGFRGAHSSGHCYFGLKDAKAKIDAVVWRGVYSKLRVKPEEGMEVIAEGRVSTFPGSSKYQLVIEKLEPAGIGALMAILAERKARLGAEGLFAPERKRALPFLPGVVGIITSPTGAVIRDMLAGFTERFPTRVIVWPVRVQGDTSASEIECAIRGFNALDPKLGVPMPDVLIVARGGGSLEDLWGFNEEALVRAAAQSRIPIIAAVGHETDWTLVDLVADARAPTPTKAAEWAVPKYADLIEKTEAMRARGRSAIRREVQQSTAHLLAAARGLPRRDDLLALPRQRFDGLERRLARGLLANANGHALRYARVADRLAPRLLNVRHAAVHARYEKAAEAMLVVLARMTARRRTTLEGIGGRLLPHVVAVRCQRSGERSVALAARLPRALAALNLDRRRRLQGTSNLLASLGYQSILARGFALIRDRDGKPVRRAAAVEPGGRLQIEFADGHASVVALGLGQTGAAGPAPAPVNQPAVCDPPSGGIATPAETRVSPRAVRATRNPGQGSLF